MERVPSFSTSLIAGGAAGLAVDLSLYPLDTLKTRLQSSLGFWKSGGFRNVYRGIAPAAAGSVPCAALFFCSYNSCKNNLGNLIRPDFQPVVHLVSASVGEIAASSIRTPVEVIKQRLQASVTKHSALQLTINLWREEGIKGFYRGLGSTILREVPFSCLQFPLWEILKSSWQEKKGITLLPWEGALCGAIAGGFSAAITTPLDVAKTRIMLYSKSSHNPIALPHEVPGVIDTLRTVYRGEGIQGLFSGITPRVIWITIGGLIFFGVYEFSVYSLEDDSNKVLKN
ncbi:S-adenosylmethionine mitochondrial carrier protein [Frankliniella fusca]|uniref:S-adenosylmethionine mitochondrial carrier protein n=1 Tax=Frankliniella fusca TaxID=407009 RepID=A0AAE1HC98_9NEOP|nr:S-adenosylmethionine mitochondrial carrier protein [Frankliniella fusca]